MNEGIQTALSLMLIGMITVGFILFLVVAIGNIIIRVTNKIKVPVVIHAARNVKETFAPNKMAAIVAAVNQVTHGKGKVTKIEKIN